MFKIIALLSFQVSNPPPTDISTSLSRYWNRTFAYASVGPSVCRSVCLESVLWQNGWLDLVAVWVSEWGLSRDECIRWDPRAPEGKGGFGGFRSHWFDWHIFNRNVFDSCVESWRYFRTDNILLEMSFYWLSKIIVNFNIDGVCKNMQKCNSHFAQKWSQAATPSSNLFR